MSVRLGAEIKVPTASTRSGAKMSSDIQQRSRTRVFMEIGWEHLRPCLRFAGRFHLTFPTWFLVHDEPKPFWIIFLLHRFASHFASTSRLFFDNGGCFVDV